jgi:hypothetical protein
VNWDRKYGIVSAFAEKFVTDKSVENLGVPMPSPFVFESAARTSITVKVRASAIAATPSAALEIVL